MADMKKSVPEEVLKRKTKEAIEEDSKRIDHYYKVVSIISDTKDDPDSKKIKQYSLRIPRYIFEEANVNPKKDKFKFYLIPINLDPDKHSEKFEFTITAELIRSENAEGNTRRV